MSIFLPRWIDNFAIFFAHICPLKNCGYEKRVFRDLTKHTFRQTNIAGWKIPILPGKYHQNDGFSIAMLAYRSVQQNKSAQSIRSVGKKHTPEESLPKTISEVSDKCWSIWEHLWEIGLPWPVLQSKKNQPPFWYLMKFAVKSTLIQRKSNKTKKKKNIQKSSQRIMSRWCLYIFQHLFVNLSQGRCPCWNHQLDSHCHLREGEHGMVLSLELACKYKLQTPRNG